MASSFLSGLDFFPKNKNEVLERSKIGGLLTIITVSLVAYLFIHEMYDFFVETNVSVAVGVDTDRADSFHVNLDIWLPALKCNEFGLDFTDLDGDQVIEVDLKTRPEGTGCRVLGTELKVWKIQGEFHIAFGRKAEAMDTNHIHRFTWQELQKFNCSHAINHLSFGKEFPGVVHPLDGTVKITPQFSGRYMYFLTIVPTTYRYLDGSEIYTHQYSVSQLDSLVNVNLPSFKQPGIFFKFDISPYAMVYIEGRKPWSHFITSLCALIGGVVVVVGILNGSIVWFMERVLSVRVILPTAEVKRL